MCSMIHPTLKQEITGLDELPRSEMVARWQSLYRAAPPKGISRTLLVRAIAYQMQVKVHRGLKPATKRRLQSAAKGLSRTVEPSPSRRPALQPGTRLIREWNGATHRVAVVDGGYVWNGKQFRSLSAVARAITGARWSGPRFFGQQQVGTS